MKFKNTNEQNLLKQKNYKKNKKNKQRKKDKNFLILLLLTSKINFTKTMINNKNSQQKSKKKVQSKVNNCELDINLILKKEIIK